MNPVMFLGLVLYAKVSFTLSLVVIPLINFEMKRFYLPISSTNNEIAVGNGKSFSSSSVLVGAPRANSTASAAQRRLFQPGAIYACPFKLDDADSNDDVADFATADNCSQIPLDLKGRSPIQVEHWVPSHWFSL